MKLFHGFRPHFQFHSPLPVEEAAHHLDDLVKGEHPDYVGRMAREQRHAELRIPMADRHLWSPTLSVNLAASEEQTDGTQVTGLIAPHPNVWTAVMFCNLAFATGVLFLLTFGGVQLWLGHWPWAFVGAGVLLILLVVVYLISQAGQKLGAPQAVHLRHLLEAALAAPAEEIHRTDKDPYHA